MVLNLYDDIHVYVQYMGIMDAAVVVTAIVKSIKSSLLGSSRKDRKDRLTFQISPQSGIKTVFRQNDFRK